MAQYQVVVIAEGQFFQYAPKDMEAFGAACGYQFEGIEAAPRLREELRGHPKFRELCGPMWGGEKDGEPVIRYESWPAYERLSA